MFAILRRDESRDTICCFAKTLEGAENLADQYQQAWDDSGGEEHTYYYVVGNIFYDK